MNSGQKETTTLAAGQILTVVAPPGTTGLAVRLSRLPGGGDAQSVTAIAGADLTFGPYTNSERFEISCTLGPITYSAASVDPSSVQFDDEATTALALKINHALATATSDFLLGNTGGGTFIKKTLEQTKTILGLETYAPIADPTFTGAAAFGIMALPEKTPVNAVAASGVVTFTGQPLDYVANVNASGVITVSGTPVAEEQMTVGAQLFTFKASGTALGNIVISATPAVQAANIVTSITRDLTTVTAVAVDAVITVTAVALGVAGNDLAAIQTATGIAWSGVSDNKLSGGVDGVLETLTIGTQAFKFVTLRGAVGSFEITSNANVTTQAGNAKAAINADLTNVTADNTDGVLTITAAVKGVSGNLIALSEAATGTEVSSVTEGKLDGGVNGTVGVANETCADATYLYHCIATNTIADANWRKITLNAI